MPRQSTQFRNAKREGILKTFSSEYRKKWYEMRSFQNKRYEPIQTYGIFFLASLIFVVGGGMLLIPMVKEFDDVLFPSIVIGIGIFYFIFFFIVKKKEKKDRPELRQKIRILKRSLEIKTILKAFKEAEVEWTVDDDAEVIG